MARLQARPRGPVGLVGFAVVAVGILIGPGPAAAQPTAHTSEAVTNEHVGVDPAALRSLRLGHRRERTVEGGVLLGWGAANVLGGGILAATAGREDPFWLSFGLMSAGWGLINGLLSIALFDPSGQREAEIREGRLGSGADASDDPGVVAERLERAELRGGQIFALNLGLDVFYVATGVLLLLLGGDRNEPTLEGAGASLVGQGAFLFAFDVAGWRGANRRADELQVLGAR